MKAPKFTEEQRDWICYAIGEWYLAWKTNICPAGVEHKLGYAKECLKNAICPHLCIDCQAEPALFGIEHCEKCMVYKDHE